MSLRISSFGLALLLIACGSETSAPDGEAIECAIGPGSEFSPVCTLEETSDEEFILHHPDGGFRRFRHTVDGVEISDGADAVEDMSGVSHGYLEFSVDDDRYRLPLAPDARD